MDETTDKINIRDLCVKSQIGLDLWGNRQPQPIIVNITIHSQPNVVEPRPIDYGEFCKFVTGLTEEQSDSMEALAARIARGCLEDTRIPRAQWASVKIEKPCALLHATSAGIEIKRAAGSLPVSEEDIMFVKDLRLTTTLGVTPWEREQKQPVILNLTIYYDNKARHNHERINSPSYRLIVRTISKHVEGCNYRTMESLVASIARIAITECQLNKITVRLEKPGALLFANSAGVEITRTLEAYRLTTNIPAQFNHFAFVFIRSNKIDIAVIIDRVMEKLKENCMILDTSFLYEIAPKFHAACKVATDLSLKTLQEELKKKAVEVQIELKVIVYDEEITPDLNLDNHEFILKPLYDIAVEVNQLLTQLLYNSEYDSQARKVIPIRKSKWFWRERTFVMGILDINNGDTHAVVHAKALISEGADIIDIEGMPEISEKEELERVIPIIKAIRANGINDVPISINTRRATVAEEAIVAGADMINDSSGGTLDPRMYSVMAKKNVPVCLQHIRNSELLFDDVVSGVCAELKRCVDNAIQAGVKSWNIVINPGLSSTDTAQDHQVLKRLSDIVGDDSPFEGFPSLVYVRDPAVCTLSVAGGADILQVSDVRGMSDPIRAADNMFRN